MTAGLASARKRILVILCGLALFGGAIAQHAPRALAQNARDRHWRIFRYEDGLISNDIWSIFIDDGVVWLGADVGIARYDGEWRNFYNLDSYNPDVPAADAAAFSGLKRGHVVALADSSQPGSLWAGSADGYIARWDGEEWSPALQVPAEIHALHEANGHLFIGTSLGFWRAELPAGTLELITPLGETPARAIQPDGDSLWVGTDAGLWRLADGQWSQTPLPDLLASAQINALWLDPDGVLWLGGPDGVIWYDAQTGQWADIVLPITDQYNNVTPVLTLTGDDGGAVWAGSDGGGARKFTDYGLVTIDYSRASGGGLTTPIIGDIGRDTDGSLWFATPVGLFQFQEQIWLSDFQVREGLDASINAVNDLLVDRRNGLWIATAGSGVRHKVKTEIGYQEERFTVADSGLPVDVIYSLAEDSAGGIWAGTAAGPVRYMNGEWTAPVNALTLPSSVITALLPQEDRVWIGTEMGLLAYDLGSDALTEASPLAGLSVEALATDNLGQLWAGTRASGIFVLRNNGRWQQFVNDAQDPKTFPGAGVLANGLTPDPSTPGGMWVITPGTGLAHWDGQRWRAGDPNRKLPDSLPYRVYTDRVDGSLWVGSETGVSRFDGLTWGAFTIEDGLQSTATYAIAQEQDGSYWFGGPEGLTRYWPEQTQPWVRATPLSGFVPTENGLEALLDGAVEIGLTYGDLQTPRERIDLFYREGPDEAWNELQKDALLLPLAALGPRSVEFMARDLAFNYSQPVSQSFNVVSPPRVASLPILGEVEQGVFWTLLVLASTALLGFSYVSFEIIQNHRRINDAVRRGYNPYVSGDPVRTEEMFFGRRQTVQRIVDTLHNNSIMIHGERRIGKTTLLYQLANVLSDVNDPEFWFIPIYVDLEGTRQDEFFHFLIEEIVRGVMFQPDYSKDLQPMIAQLAYHDIASADYRDRDFSVDIRTLINGLQDHGAGNHPGRRLRIILLMDEMDVMSGYDHVLQQQLRRIFMRDFSSTLGAVVAGIQISKEWDRVESPWFNLFNEIEIEPFAREDALALLVEPVRDVYSYDALAVEFILDVSAGRPFRVQQYGLESVNHMLSAGRRRIMMEDVEAAHARIQSSVSTEYADVGLAANLTAHRTHGGVDPPAPGDAARFSAGDQERGQWARA